MALSTVGMANTLMGQQVIKYFEVWNAHDVPGIKALHAATSKLTDWDSSHGPTNEEVSQGIAGIWSVSGASNSAPYLC